MHTDTYCTNNISEATFRQNPALWLQIICLNPTKCVNENAAFILQSWCLLPSCVSLEEVAEMGSAGMGLVKVARARDISGSTERGSWHWQQRRCRGSDKDILATQLDICTYCWKRHASDVFSFSTSTATMDSSVLVVEQMCIFEINLGYFAPDSGDNE